MIFHERLKELRETKGISQMELAKNLKMSQSAIAKWEKEKTEPTASAIILLSQYFGVSSDYLLGLENEDGTKSF